MQDIVKNLKLDQSTELTWRPRFGLSVNLIVKDCAESLRRCLESLAHFVHPETDEIVIVDTGSSDDTVAVARSMGARVIERPDLRQDVRPYVEAWLPSWKEKLDADQMFKGGCILDFAGARQIATDASKNDWIFWIDSDDILVEKVPGLLRQKIDEYCGTKLSQLFLDYEYAFDENGNCITVLKRERVCNRQELQWVGRCHETMIPKPGVTPNLPSGGFADKGVTIRHVGARHDHTISDIRNYIIIRREVEESLQAGEQPDVRSIFYLGNAARGLERFKEAEGLYKKTIKLSGSRDDRYSAAYYCALMYLHKTVQRPLDARKWAYKCLQLNPADPRGQFLLSRCAFALGRFEEAMYWYEAGALLPFPETLHSIDPEQITTQPALVAAQAARELGQQDKVIELVNKAAQGRWDIEPFASIRSSVENWVAGRKLTEAVGAITANFNGSPVEKAEKARRMLCDIPAIPKEILQRGLAPDEPEDTRPYVEGKDIALFCGHTAEPWGPDVTAIGGSEKMVIQMAPRLQARGFRVTVYANVPQNEWGIHKATGVRWQHWAQFNMARSRDTLIAWRAVGAVTMPCPAKKRILWCHDVQNPANYSPTVMASLDEVWLLSEYHVSTLGPITKHPLMKGKIWITRNGLDRKLFEEVHAQKLERKQKRVVYCSSPDRGAITAIRTFQRAFPNDMEAELHICYGFNKAYMEWAKQAEYGGIPDLGRDANYYEYMEEFYKLVDEDPRITYWGRIGWKDLCELMFQSGVWLYPTRFPEISCMAAMEAQAAGCKVVATEYAALAETIGWDRNGKFSIVPDPDNAGPALAAAVAQPFDSDTEARHYQQVFDFEALADEWAERIQR